jgi:hypothetical protein
MLTGQDILLIQDHSLSGEKLRTANTNRPIECVYRSTYERRKYSWILKYQKLA